MTTQAQSDKYMNGEVLKLMNSSEKRSRKGLEFNEQASQTARCRREWPTGHRKTNRHGSIDMAGARETEKDECYDS